MPEKLAPVKEKELKVKGWPFDADRIKAMLADEKETRKEIELAPGIKMTFVRIPAGQFVMGSYRGQSDTRPTAKVKIDKAFWMGELEVTNSIQRDFPGSRQPFRGSAMERSRGSRISR